MSLIVPKAALPGGPAERHGRLRDYFCDKDATAVAQAGGWRLELRWPGGQERHVDPRIGPELQRWGDIGLDGMAGARRRAGRVLTCLYDTWTLESWSRWAAREGIGADAAITVLHVDDHRDLGSPRLRIAEDGRLSDMITDMPFDVMDPASVERARESGAVGMGSFLTPFLLAFPRCDVRQLGQAPKITGTTDHAIIPATQADDLLHPGALRPAVRLDASTDAGFGRYRSTDDLGAWLADVGPGPVLLHVDMDYFNNRYDGDGDWPDRRSRHDPPLEAVLSRIDEVTAAIRGSDVLDRTADAVVAFSPGFFPAEMWGQAEARLRSGLEVLYE